MAKKDPTKHQILQERSEMLEKMLELNRVAGERLAHALKNKSTSSTAYSESLDIWTKLQEITTRLKASHDKEGNEAVVY